VILHESPLDVLFAASVMVLITLVPGQRIRMMWTGYPRLRL